MTRRLTITPITNGFILAIGSLVALFYPTEDALLEAVKSSLSDPEAFLNDAEENAVNDISGEDPDDIKEGLRAALDEAVNSMRQTLASPANATTTTNTPPVATLSGNINPVVSSTPNATVGATTTESGLLADSQAQEHLPQVAPAATGSPASTAEPDGGGAPAESSPPATA